MQRRRFDPSPHRVRGNWFRLDMGLSDQYDKTSRETCRRIRTKDIRSTNLRGRLDLVHQGLDVRDSADVSHLAFQSCAVRESIEMSTVISDGVLDSLIVSIVDQVISIGPVRSQWYRYGI